MSEEQRNRWQGITDAVDELKQKRFELAEREFHSMDEGEIIDLLITFVYNKMSDKAVKKLHRDIFTYGDSC
jgi:guanylate kinase